MTIANVVAEHVSSLSKFLTAIGDRHCPTCGMVLIEKGGWIFCPKNSTDIPDCDSPYHIAQHQETGAGWMAAPVVGVFSSGVRLDVEGD